jgi:hypothetical protein
VGISGDTTPINFSFFLEIHYRKFSNKFVANNSVFMIVPIRKLVVKSIDYLLLLNICPRQSASICIFIDIISFYQR